MNRPITTTIVVALLAIYGVSAAIDVSLLTSSGGGNSSVWFDNAAGNALIINDSFQQSVLLDNSSGKLLFGNKATGAYNGALYIDSGNVILETNDGGVGSQEPSLELESYNLWPTFGSGLYVPRVAGRSSFSGLPFMALKGSMYVMGTSSTTFGSIVLTSGGYQIAGADQRNFQISPPTNPSTSTTTISNNFGPILATLKEINITKASGYAGTGSNTGQVNVLNNATVGDELTTKSFFYKRAGDSTRREATGYIRYVDETYTSANPLMLTSTPYNLSLAQVNISAYLNQSPEDINQNDWFNGTHFKTDKAFNGFLYKFHFKVKPLGSNLYCESFFHLGTHKHPARALTFPKGVNVEQIVSFTNAEFPEQDWASTGARLEFVCSGNVEIYDMELTVQRTHIAK